MPKNTKEIAKVIDLIKNHVEQFQDPIITEIGEDTKDPFQVLISCILSLRTKDETTAKASVRLFKLAKTPEEMITLDTRKIARAIYPVGFYKTKARRIKEICKKLISEYNSKVPDSFDELMKFKGVGRKTANIVMVYGFEKEGLPIDTHCHRIPNRLGWIKTKTPEKTEQELRKLLPKKYWNDFNDVFVTFGQNTCKPVKPHCWECPVTKYCQYYRKVYLPKIKKRKYK